MLTNRRHGKRVRWRLERQLDFCIRGPESDDRNHPAPAVFDHFFATEVTWR